MVALAATPRVAVLSTAGGLTTLRLQPVGAAELAPVECELHHADGSSVLGALAGTTVLATATMASGGDLSFASSLFRLDARRPTELVDRVALSSRPVVVGDRRVFVQRGRPGPGRVDELTIDEVDPFSRAVHTVYATQGYVTYIAGTLGPELIIYEVTRDGARLLAVHVDTLSKRVLRESLAPLARDFVIDETRRRVVYTLGTTGENWSVEATSLDLHTPGSTTLAHGQHVALLPTVTPDGHLWWSRGPGEGLHALGGEQRVLKANGRGYERVRAFVGGLVIGLHELPSDFAVPFAIRLKDGASLRLVAPPATRLDVAGVLP